MARITFFLLPWISSTIPTLCYVSMNCKLMELVKGPHKDAISPYTLCMDCSNSFYEFADGTAMVGRISKNNDAEYRRERERERKLSNVVPRQQPRPQRQQDKGAS